MAQDVQKSKIEPLPAGRQPDIFTAMRDEMDRVFESFIGRRGLGWPALARDPAMATMTPRVDIREDADAYVIEAELPGLEEKDVKVTLDDEMLTIKGEKRSEREEKKDNYHLSERSFGSFERRFRLPEGADGDNIAAHVDKGVLKITVGKRPLPAKPAAKSIPIGKSA